MKQKETVEVEVHYCDDCGKSASEYNGCKNCGKDFCHDCAETNTVGYSAMLWAGYCERRYCTNCNFKLADQILKEGYADDPFFGPYYRLHVIRRQAEEYNKKVKEQGEEVEDVIKNMIELEREMNKNG